MGGSRFLVLGFAAAALCAAGTAGAAEADKRPVAVAEGGPATDTQARPPRRLWYRITVRFKGRQVRTPTDETRELVGQYRLRANAATLVTANCTGPRFSAAGVSCREARQRIRRNFTGDERRRRLAGLRESYSFRANLTGNIFGHRVRGTVDPVTVTTPTGGRAACSPSAQTTTQLQEAPQRALGQVASVSGRGARNAGSAGGVRVLVRTAGRSSRLVTSTPVTCPTFRDDPPEFTVGGDSVSDEFSWLPLHRDNLNVINGKPQVEHLAFRRAGGRFGRTFSIRRTISERGPRRDDRGRVADTLQVSRVHTYTLIFRVCARGGRAPRSC
ncbi:MAG: hypothetical protein ACR2N6_07315 [Miltoncostaeaceae bacterium]